MMLRYKVRTGFKWKTLLKPRTRGVPLFVSGSSQEERQFPIIFPLLTSPSQNS